jgi:uncharacterized protein (TIGR00730 family)
MKRICVFCGSSSGKGDVYIQAATDLGKELASQGIELVYGGASVGTMGAVADAVLANGGKVIGVIPQGIADLEVAHTGLTKLEVVADMHERKARMMTLSDAFIALPGGLGTLEELFEVLTWLQLRFHNKPCGVLNVASYYDHLINFLSHASEQGFAKQAHIDSLLVSDDSQSMIDALREFELPTQSKLTG